MNCLNENQMTRNNFTQKRQRQKYGIVKTQLVDVSSSLLRLLWDDAKFVALFAWALTWCIPFFFSFLLTYLIAYIARGKEGVEIIRRAAF